MSRRIFIFQIFLISFCFCEFSESKDKLINAILNSLNALSSPYVYEEADLIKTQELNPNEIYIEIRVKASDPNNVYATKYQNCSEIVILNEDGHTTIKDIQCSDYVESQSENIEELVTDLTTNAEPTENLEELVTDVTTVVGPIQLENEVQSENMSTSGERFIAVPRDEPAPCIGCASSVDPSAAGVQDLATLGIRQLDRHEPTVSHALANVLAVERQVQVVGGVRYILTLAVDYNNCTLNEIENCNFQKTCQVSVLEKPWRKLPDGSKFRAIISNNCTEEWLFDENGLPKHDSTFNNHSIVIENPNADGTTDDIIHAVHNSEVQAEPPVDRTLTPEQIKELEEQIIPLGKVNRPLDNNYYSVSGVPENANLVQKANNLESAKPPNDYISTPQPDEIKNSDSLSADKQKAVDELLNFFEFSGFKDNSNDNDLLRMKRDYGADLQMLDVAKTYKDMKTKIENAQYIHKLAQSMVDYLNEMDIEVKARVLKEVISAEEELENGQRYFYIQAHVAVPCDGALCKKKDAKTCNGIIDASGDRPLVLYATCIRNVHSLGKQKKVQDKDPILLKLVNQAMKKIDLESKIPFAFKVKDILSASTQRVTGILTKIAVEIEYTTCNKSVPLFKRNNCAASSNLGYKICDIEVLQRHWLRESKITYVCTEKPAEEMLVGDSSRTNIDDSQVREIVNEALQYLEEKSNRNNRQKLVQVQSVTTQQVTGLLTNIIFIVGYTACTSEFKEDVNTCDLLKNEALRICTVEVWERPWLDDARRVNVTCHKLESNNNTLKRQKRSPDLYFTGAPIEKNETDPQYRSLAEKSLQKYLKDSGNTQHHQIISVDKVTVQVVSGILTEIDFHISPTNCQVDADGKPTSTNCIVQSAADTINCQSKIWERSWLNSTEINVKCDPNGNISRKRRNIQIIGNEIEKDPNEYKKLTEDCLINFMLTYDIIQHYKVDKILKAVKVNTTGDLTKIDFQAVPTNCTVENGYPTSFPCEVRDSSEKLSCHAEIWVKPVLNSRIMNVNCQIDEKRLRRKRAIVGGETLQDASDPKYEELAKKSLTKYVRKSRKSHYHKVVSVDSVSTQVVSGIKTKILFKSAPTNCLVDKRGRPTSSLCEIENPENIKSCSAEIWEQPWLGKEEITVSCHPAKSRQKRQLPGGQKTHDPNDPKYIQLAKESLSKFLLTSGATGEHKVIQILKVTTQVVSGSMTRIDYKVQSPSEVLDCHSKIWEQPWLDKKEIDVNCSPTNSRQKRQLRGGQKTHDPNDPKYIQLAKESLSKFLLTSGATGEHKVIQIVKVTTQVVSGSITRIDYKVQSPSEVLDCHSEIWEQPWLDKKEIDVNCSPTDSRQKRQLAGGQTTQDPTHPEYKQLAEESLSKFLLTSGATGEHKVIQILKVTTQVVAGSKTRIDFKVQSPSEVLDCHSEIWEQKWLDKKEIDVNCSSTNSRQKRQIPGGETTHNSNDPKYIQLAKESLSKFLLTSGATGEHKVIQILKVTTQVESGSMTRIDYKVQSPSEILDCHSEIWEQPWLGKEEITVSCHPAKSRQKRQLPGGQKKHDPNDPKYIQLAKESLSKFLLTSGATGEHKVIQILKVTTQVVSGSMTRIDYKVQSPSEVLDCHSKIWEQPWLDKKEIDVNCSPTNSRQKRQLRGGQKTHDPNDPQYIQLAKESLSKFLLTSGATGEHKVIQILKVTTQVVAGSKTRIDFKVQSPSEVLDCHSEIWEQKWLDKKEIDVNCSPTNSRQKRQIRGGQKTRDPNDPKYKQLAQESLSKFKSTSGATGEHKIIQILKVTTQVVAGSKTRIDFKVQSPSDVLDCHSEIWEQPWLDKKEIDINCSPAKFRTQRDVPLSIAASNIIRLRNMNKQAMQKIIRSGGYQEKDPSKHEYSVLAASALQKYQRKKKSEFSHKVLEVKHVTSQVVSGTKYIILFTAAPTTCPSNISNVDLCEVQDTILYCNAKIWDRPWLKRKQIDVNCNSDDDGDDAESDEMDDTNDEVQSNNNSKKSRNRRELTTVNSIKVISEYNANPTIVPISASQNETVKRYHHENEEVKRYHEKMEIYNSKEYLNLAEDALRKYETESESELLYKVVKIHYVNEQEDVGIRIRMDFSASPSNCLKFEHKNISNCEFKEPKDMISCHADIRFTLMLDANLFKSIDVKCSQRPTSIRGSGHDYDRIREKRQVPPDEYIEDDVIYYYADRVMSQLNTKMDGNNLYKLVTIHDIRRSMHMRVPLVRMYIEITKSYCLRDQNVQELSSCNVIEGLSNILCFSRIWPSLYDEIVIEDLDTICEDDIQNFARLTGFAKSDLLAASMYILNRDGPYKYFHVHAGQYHVIPSLDFNKPILVHFAAAITNCTKAKAASLDLTKESFMEVCQIDAREMAHLCVSQIFINPSTKSIGLINVTCSNQRAITVRSKRSIPTNVENITNEDINIQRLVQESLHKLEMVSAHRYKQRVLTINRHSTKLTTKRITTIDFDVGYTNCLKFEWVDNITNCEFLEHLPRRHCVSEVMEMLWVDNGREIDVHCDDDETPLEANMELETAETAMTLGKEALKRIEYKYPHPRKQTIVRIFSLEKQMIAGLHYRMKMEVGYTNCMALSVEDNCKFDPDLGMNKFCRVNVWHRTWTNHPPSYRVTCDYHDTAFHETYFEIQASELFLHFVATYKPTYIDDHEEMSKRYQIFKENVRKIHELNVNERGTATYAVTRFADLSHEEFRAKYLGLDTKLRNENDVPMPQAEIPKVNIPDSFDWRDQDTVTEVKDQGSCGSCWAFSVTGNIEGQWKRHSGKLVSLSEQELVDCDKLDQGCNGGLPDNAYRAIEQLGGLELESDYPYEGVDDKCEFNKTLSRVQISGAVNISSNETNMAKWLVENGPISIGINANAMQFYVGGISHPWRMLCDPNNLDHGVLIVGYGVKDYPLFNKKLPYWIIKNSWGKSWGEQGYYRVYRGDGTCGVNMMASSAVI